MCGRGDNINKIKISEIFIPIFPFLAGKKPLGEKIKNFAAGKKINLVQNIHPWKNDCK